MKTIPRQLLLDCLDIETHEIFLRSPKRRSTKCGQKAEDILNIILKKWPALDMPKEQTHSMKHDGGSVAYGANERDLVDILALFFGPEMVVDPGTFFEQSWTGLTSDTFVERYFDKLSTGIQYCEQVRRHALPSTVVCFLDCDRPTQFLSKHDRLILPRSIIPNQGRLRNSNARFQTVSNTHSQTVNIKASPVLASQTPSLPASNPPEAYYDGLSADAVLSLGRICSKWKLSVITDFFDQLDPEFKMGLSRPRLSNQLAIDLGFLALANHSLTQQAVAGALTAAIEERLTASKDRAGVRVWENSLTEKDITTVLNYPVCLKLTMVTIQLPASYSDPD